MKKENEVERFLENFERENIIFDDNIKNIKRLKYEIKNIKDENIVIKNNIVQKKQDTKTVNIIFIFMILLTILIAFLVSQNNNIYVLMQYIYIGLGLYIIIFLPQIIISYFHNDFYEIEYLKDIGLIITTKRKKIIIEKTKLKKIYLKVDLSFKVIKNELYKKIESREDVNIIGNDSSLLYGKPTILLYMYVEYVKTNKLKKIRLDVNNVSTLNLKDFINIFEI